MFDIGWQEIFLIAILALIVIGPKDLPRALKTVTAAIRKVKGMARDFQSGLDDIVRETELDEMRKQIEAETGGDIRKRIEESIDPEGEISRDLDDMRSLEGDLNAAARGVGDDIKNAEIEAEAVLPDPNDAFASPPPPPPPPPTTVADAVGEGEPAGADGAKKD